MNNEFINTKLAWNIQQEDSYLWNSKCKLWSAYRFLQRNVIGWRTNSLPHEQQYRNLRYDGRTHACIHTWWAHYCLRRQGLCHIVHGPHVRVNRALRFPMRRDDPDYNSKRIDDCEFRVRGEMVWSQESGVFQQECNSEGALFGNAPHRRIDQT